MQKLVAGIHKFQREVFAPQRDLFQRLAKGQSPETLLITCSDSRIDPNLITQTDPGDLFIMRNAGNIVPPHGAAVGGGEAATIEFAVSGLGVRDIIVCGHSLCGAMAALAFPEKAAGLVAMSAWLGHAEATRQIVAANYGHLHGDELTTVTVEENVLVQLENLRTHPAVAARLARGDLNLHGWVYKLETGTVFYFDHEQSQFMRLDTDWQPAAAPPPRIGLPSI